jgi:branched-chain amino acid transport system permease protein
MNSRFWPIRLGSLVAGVGGAFLIELMSHQYLTDYAQRLVVLIGLFVTLSVSLNLINGITGQFSIGHAAFYQIGAYFTGYISIRFYQTFGHDVGGGLPWLILMMGVGAIGAAVAGLVVGLPSLRLRGDYLAIVTMGFGEIVRIVVQNQPALGGAYGMQKIPPVKSIFLVWVLAFVCIAVCRNLLKTARGLTFVSVREDEVASSAMGVNVTRVKVTAFMLGAAFAGAAGVLFSHYETFITPTEFTMDVSFIILTMVVLGGTGSITGSIFAAVFLSYLPEYLRTLKAPDGGALHVSGGTILTWLIMVFALVTMIRWVSRSHYVLKRRLAMYVGLFVGGLIVGKILSILIGLIKPISDISVEAGQLRMVIFAVSLIAIMLIRPQGVFSHHEFSWSWVKKLLKGGKVPNTAVSS